MKSVRVLCLIVGLMQWTPDGWAQLAKLYPIDEATANPELFSLRAQLQRAVAVRDTAYLYSVLAPDILNSFGGDGGRAEFREKWRTSDPASALWSELSAILSLGGAFHDDTLFLAPYVHSNFPGEFDGFEHVVVIGNNVRARAAPSTAANELTTLSFDIVPIARAAEQGGNWQAIQLADGRTAYVHRDYVRSPHDYRAGFVKRGERWLLRVLIAGD